VEAYTIRQECPPFGSGQGRLRRKPRRMGQPIRGGAKAGRPPGKLKKGTAGRLSL
jgi:hypothetical protein